MRATKYFAIIAAALSLAACNNDENLTPDKSEVQPLFTGSIGEMKTRAYDQSWEAADQIGISGKSGEVTYTNVCHVTENGDGNFSPTAEPIYFQTTDDVTFTAYYPWNNLAEGATTISADTWRQAEQKTFDFLYATAVGSKANHNVAFNFQHSMTKLVLTLKPGTGVSYEEVKAAEVMLEYFLAKGEFDVTTGVATASGTATTYYAINGNTGEAAAYNAPFVENETNKTLAYSLILFPQSFEGAASKMVFTATLAQDLTAEIDFTSANADAGDTAAKNELVAGRQYNIPVTLNKTSLTVGACTIADWTPANGGDVSAE